MISLKNNNRIIEKIKKESELSSKKFISFNYQSPKKFIFSIAPHHFRAKRVKTYFVSVGTINKIKYCNALIMMDKKVKNLIFLQKFLKKQNGKLVIFDVIEAKIKTKPFADEFINTLKNQTFEKLIVIGGGVLLNVGAYIAEQLFLDLIQVPTTVLSMAD